MMRSGFQRLGRSRAANRLARKYGLRFGASRFVAGETVRQAIEAMRKLNGMGRAATLDHLGEFVSSAEEADESAAMCLRTLDAIAEANADCNLSLKLTSLGLDLDRTLCLARLRSILDRARQYGNFVRIDMEDYSHCQATLDIYRELRKTYDNVGVVVQAYLFRSERDVEKLRELKPNLRLVKGAYKESPLVAYPDKRDVDANYRKLIRMQLLSGDYAAIATHDEKMVSYALNVLREHGLPRERMEFQMLYGIAEELQNRLVREGFRVRVYVPFGRDWFGYFARRLAERPANVRFVLKNLFK